MTPDRDKDMIDVPDPQTFVALIWRLAILASLCFVAWTVCGR